MFRKTSLVMVFAIVLVLAFSGLAMAAQATATINAVYPTSPDSLKTYTSTPKVFNSDGKTNYPYEIYLPNEASPASYRIHTNYTKNTDACASCHATHTAVGESLLQWYTVYDTCMACHDGTVTTTYNVENGKIGSTGSDAKGGMFGSGTHASSHNVVGAVEIAAAPGGSVVSETVNVEGSSTKAKTRWAAEFGCQSCHTPHGQGGNARILNPDVNWAATAARALAYQVDEVTGNVYNANNVNIYILKGYPYAPAIKYNGSVLSGAYIDNTTGVSKIVYTGIEGLTGVTVEGTAALTVKMNVGSYLQAGETVGYTSGINAFCGACHTDYNTAAFTASGSGEIETGVYSKAHRHQVGNNQSYKAAILAKNNMPLESGNIACLTCHFAHGTTQNYWFRTLSSLSGSEYFGDAEASFVELAGSSALKRQPNMGVCEACHDKSDGNQGYSANTSQADVVATAAIDNTPNFNSGLFARAFRFVNNDLAVPATLLSDVYYSSSKNTSDANRYYYEYLLDPSGVGVFANEKYVGSDKCESCHKEYYEGWEVSHGESFEPISKRPDVLAEFAKNIGTNVSASSAVEDTNAAAFGNRVSYTVDSYTATSMTWTAAVGGTVYTTNASDIDFIWMNHYVLKTIDASKGIYLRVATWDENAPAGEPKLKPIFDRTTALPSNESFVSWYQTVTWNGTTATASGNAAEGCISCHSPQNVNALGTADKTIACESCHGPASRHVAAPSSANILNPKTKLNFAEQQGLCLSCHSGKHNAVSTFKTSKHYNTAGVGCTTCHDVHNTIKGDGQHSSLKVSETNKNQLCASCHDTVIDVDSYMKSGIEGVYKFAPDTATMWTRHGFDAAIK